MVGLQPRPIVETPSCAHFWQQQAVRARHAILVPSSQFWLAIVRKLFASKVLCESDFWRVGAKPRRGRGAKLRAAGKFTGR